MVIDYTSKKYILERLLEIDDQIERLAKIKIDLESKHNKAYYATFKFESDQPDNCFYNGESIEFQKKLLYTFINNQIEWLQAESKELMAQLSKYIQ